MIQINKQVFYMMMEHRKEIKNLCWYLWTKTMYMYITSSGWEVNYPKRFHQVYGVHEN